ncbi:MAG: hypothetical protein GXN94_00285 [Aquificae bacterium]|nr:hypothetical protein [Aquificota bacterium]
MITGKDTPINRLSKEELKEIYLKIRVFVNGQQVIPVNLPPNSPVRKVFQKKVLEMDDEQLNLYWNEMYFHGIEPPLVLSSEEAVKRFVKKVKGAIGYISKEKVEKGLKILYTIREDEKGTDN